MTHPFFSVGSPCVLGHRGAAGECPENTLTSFERALARGAHIIESDLQMSREATPLLFHDDEVGRTTNGVGRLDAMSLDELRQLDAGYHFVGEGQKRPLYRGRGLRIPTLEEALCAFAGVRFNLEIKHPAEALIESTLDCIEKTGSASTVLLTAGDGAVMAALRRAVARRGVDVALGASASEVGAFLQSAIKKTPPQRGPMALQVPTHFGKEPLVTRDFVDHAHRHGIAVHVWTINDPDTMHTLFDLGVDGVVTDWPKRAVDVIASRRG